MDTLFRLDDSDRLTLQGKVFDPLSTACLRKLRIRPGMRCLEIGAGSGSIARWLCRQVGYGEVVATDLYATPLDEPNLTALAHDVTAATFPDDSFDLIHTRFVLSHLPNRREVLEKMTRWLRPGGLLVLESFSWFPVDSSPNPSYSKALSRWSDLLADTVGTDSRWSRAYPAPLADHGLVGLGARMITEHVRGGTPLADFWRLTLEVSRTRLQGLGYLTEQELNAAQLLLRHPEFWDLAPALAQTWGRRPRRGVS